MCIRDRCVYVCKQAWTHGRTAYFRIQILAKHACTRPEKKKRAHTQSADKPDNGTVTRGQVSLEDKHHLYGCVRVCAQERVREERGEREREKEREKEREARSARGVAAKQNTAQLTV